MGAVEWSVDIVAARARVRVASLRTALLHWPQHAMRTASNLVSIERLPASFRAAGTMRVRAFAALLVASCASLIVAEDSGSADYNGEAQAAAQADSVASAASSSSSSSSQKPPIDYGDPGTWRLDDL